jgi:hypothetical protein
MVRTPGLPHGVANPNQFGDVEAGRLFEDEVLAGARRADGFVGMQVVGGRNRNDVDVARRQQLPVVAGQPNAGERDARLRQRRARPLDVAAADPGDPRPRVLLKCRNVLRCAPAGAAHGDTKRPIGCGHRGGGSLNYSGRERKSAGRFPLELLPWLAEDTVGSTESPACGGRMNSMIYTPRARRVALPIHHHVRRAGEEGWHPSRVVNLSESGVLFGPTELTPGTSVEVILSPPMQVGTCRPANRSVRPKSCARPRPAPSRRDSKNAASFWRAGCNLRQTRAHAIRAIV